MRDRVHHVIEPVGDEPVDGHVDERPRTAVFDQLRVLLVGDSVDEVVRPEERGRLHEVEAVALVGGGRGAGAEDRVVAAELAPIHVHHVDAPALRVGRVDPRGSSSAMMRDELESGCQVMRVA